MKTKKNELYLVVDVKDFQTQTTLQAAEKYAKEWMNDDAEELVIFKAVKKYSRKSQIIVSDF